MNMESRTEAITREIFSQVRTSIVMKMRFLDMAVFKLKAFPTQLTFATDGTFLYYRPIWLLKQYQKEPNNVTRDYMHILLHCIFRHPFVNTLVDQQLWNLSCDIAAEAIIADLSQQILSTRLEIKRSIVLSGLQSKIQQLTAEKLYHYFQNNPPDPDWNELFHADDHEIWFNRKMQQSLFLQATKNDQSQQQPDDTSENESSSQGDDDSEQSNDETTEKGSSAYGNNASIQEEKSQSITSSNISTNQFMDNNDGGLPQSNVKEEWKKISERIQFDLESFTKEQGHKAGNMQQLIASINRERYNFEDFLKKFAVLGEVIKINEDEFDYIFYTYGLKLYKNMPLIEPLEYKEVKRIRDFVIAIDTSGSTSGTLVNRFLNKTYNTLQSTESFFSKVNIYIIQCDAEIQDVEIIKEREDFEKYLTSKTIKGLGGTDFRPVFTYVDQLIQNKVFSDLRGMIYFTDGYGTFPTMKPSYQTAFVFIQDKYNNVDVPPWSIKLILDKDEVEQFSS